MNNIELENKIKEIIKIENYFDLIIALKNFEKEYKASDFFKETKMPLADVLKQARIHYALQLNDLFNKVQSMIDNLDLNHLQSLLDKIANVFGDENAEITKQLDTLKDITK